MKSRSLPILLAVLLFAGAANLAFNQFKGRQNLQKEQSTLASELKDLREQRSALKAVDDLTGVITTKAAAAQKLIPLTEEREVYISQMDNLAKASGVSLEILNFTETEVKKASASEGESATNNSTPAKKTATANSGVGFSATIVGEYPAVRTFLGRLDSLERYLTLSSLDFSVQETTVSADFTGTIYFRAKPKGLSKSSFSPKSWEYLDRRELAPPQISTGRLNPFIPY